VIFLTSFDVILLRPSKRNSVLLHFSSLKTYMLYSVSHWLPNPAFL